MILYSMDNCPWCEIIKKRLTYSGISYEEVKDSGIIADFGFETVPRLQLNSGTILDYQQSIDWLNNVTK